MLSQGAFDTSFHAYAVDLDRSRVMPQADVLNKHGNVLPNHYFS
jgi:hypothetical protein